ncbi:hypothetical protein Mapa_008626 [Marchantia paleacea]|nr:hypothetical protein Mapa_008626 [Marchantia paleacea]
MSFQTLIERCSVPHDTDWLITRKSQYSVCWTCRRSNVARVAEPYSVASSVYKQPCFFSFSIRHYLPTSLI